MGNTTEKGLYNKEGSLLNGKASFFSEIQMSRGGIGGEGSRKGRKKKNREKGGGKKIPS